MAEQGIIFRSDEARRIQRTVEAHERTARRTLPPLTKPRVITSSGTGGVGAGGVASDVSDCGCSNPTSWMFGATAECAAVPDGYTEPQYVTFTVPNLYREGLESLEGLVVLRRNPDTPCEYLSWDIDADEAKEWEATCLDDNDESVITETYRWRMTLVDAGTLDGEQLQPKAVLRLERTDGGGAGCDFALVATCDNFFAHGGGRFVVQTSSCVQWWGCFCVFASIAGEGKGEGVFPFDEGSGGSFAIGGCVSDTQAKRDFCSKTHSAAFVNIGILRFEPTALREHVSQAEIVFRLTQAGVSGSNDSCYFKGCNSTSPSTACGWVTTTYDSFSDYNIFSNLCGITANILSTPTPVPDRATIEVTYTLNWVLGGLSPGGFNCDSGDMLGSMTATYRGEITCDEYNSVAPLRLFSTVYRNSVGDEVSGPSGSSFPYHPAPVVDYLAGPWYEQNHDEYWEKRRRDGDGDGIPDVQPCNTDAADDCGSCEWIWVVDDPIGETTVTISCEGGVAVTNTAGSEIEYDPAILLQPAFSNGTACEGFSCTGYNDGESCSITFPAGTLYTGWRLYDNACGEGCVAQPPETDGAFAGEIQNGSCVKA